MNFFYPAGWKLPNNINKLAKIMKISTVLFSLFIVTMSANTYSQTQRLTLNKANATVGEIFSDIESQSEFSFLFSTREIDIKQKTSVSGENMLISDILSQMFVGQDVTYRITDKHIVIYKQDSGMDFLDFNHQQITIKGNVVDEEGRVMPGVNVTVKGTTIGVVTDMNGNYSINVPDRTTVLLFSFVGYATIERSVGSETIINVSMDTDALTIEEVVVIGYGTKTKATLTGSVSVVSNQQLENRPAANVLSSMQGIVPGMVVTRGNVGRLGRESDFLGMQIRGTSSRSNPGVLIIVDGVPQTSDGAFGLYYLNSDDIESITVLKDSQAAIYGSRAAGGVILVSTKNGKGKPTISFNANVSINKPGIVRKQANILQAIEMWNEAFENDGVMNNYFTHLKPYLSQNIDLNQITVAKGPFPDTKDVTLSNYDWMDIMWGNAVQQQYSLSVSGKGAKSSYWVSAGVLDQNSMLQYGNNYNTQYYTRLKYDFDVTDYLKVRTNVALSTRKLVEPTNSDLIENLTSYSWAGKAMYTPTGKYYGFGGYLSTIGMAEQGGDMTLNHLSVNTQFEVVLTPVKNLDITAQLAINKDNNDDSYLKTGFLSYTWDDEIIFNSNLYWDGKDEVYSSYSKNNQLVTSLYANYKLDFQAHHFDFMAGVSHEEYDKRFFSANRKGNPYLITNELSWLGDGDPGQQFNNESKEHSALESIFARASYNFEGKYLVEGHFRYDASSKFAPGHKGTPFYGGSLGWVITNENFMKGISDYLNFMKLRMSYGQLGNQSGIGLYDYIQYIAFGSLTPERRSQYPFGGIDSPTRTNTTYVPSLSSPERSWEILNVFNAGTDFTVLDHRLSVGIDYFVKTNTNMFYSREFPSILGITAPSINGARLRTNGWEFMIGWKDKVRDVGYFANFILSNNKSKVLELADSRIPGEGRNAFVEGYEPGSYFTYTYDGLIQNDAELAAYKAAITSGVPTNIRTGDAKYKDLNGDGKLTPILYNPNDPSSGGDLVHIGNSNIRYSVSVNFGADWTGFYLKVLLQCVGKYMVMDRNIPAVNFAQNPLAYHYHKTWSDNRTDALYPKMSENDGIYRYNFKESDAPYMFKNAGYLRLKNIQLGYNLPNKWISHLKLQSAQIYFSGNDLAEWSGMPDGFDPEKPFTIQSAPYPRTFSFGLNISL